MYKPPFRSERNPYTGRHSAGFRFRFQVRAISHRHLFLPLQMKSLPQIQQLLQGVSPLEVFNCHSIEAARNAFNELRKQFDFPYWAINEYYVRDIDDADHIVPLWLNLFQHRIIDTFLKRYFNRENGRYIITKTFGRVGVSTCVQAYILWRQIFYSHKNSYTCSASDISINPLKTDLCRFLHRDIVPADKYIYLPMADRRAFFNTYRSPDYIRGIDLGFAHFADMSRWHDPDGDDASRAYTDAFGSVLMKHDTLLVLEGNIPKPDKFDMKRHQRLYIPRNVRLRRLAALTKNPYFLEHVALANIPNVQPHLFPINLDL